MNEAIGNYVYSLPIERDSDIWSGRIQSIGKGVEVNTTYRVCNFIAYDNNDIVDTLFYNNEMVHKLWYKNIIKIEGVY